MNKNMTPGQILTICADIASGLDGSEVTLEEAQQALKNPNCRVNIVAVLKNGGNLPTGFGKLQIIKPLEEGVITGHEFVKRARVLAESENRKNLGQTEYEFYKQKENWHLLPDASSRINVIVFVEAQCDCDGSSGVRFLQRNNLKWIEDCGCLDGNFIAACRVAVSQIGA